MAPVFLIGGGWREEGFPLTYGRFLHAARWNGVARIVIIIAEEPGVNPYERFLQSRSIFESLGAAPEEGLSQIVSPAAPLRGETLARLQPTGIFVGGGLTPAYYEALCQDRTWVEYLAEHQLPYAGFSAGAAIAATQAIVGGWQLPRGEQLVPIANENTAEEQVLLEVRPGLGLVPFAVDVHASQWGTLTRLLHTIQQGQADRGWAIDEDTMLEVEGPTVAVHGLGHAYHVQRAQSHLMLGIIGAGDTIVPTLGRPAQPDRHDL